MQPTALTRVSLNLSAITLLLSAIAGCGTSDETTSVVPDEIFVSAAATAAAPTGEEDAPFANFEVAVSTASADPNWAGSFTVLKGRYEIASEVVLPLGAELNIAAGVTFAIAASTSIHAQADVHALGTEAEPIVFTWLANEKWGSLTNFEETSQDNIFEWVIFEHGYETNFRDIGMRGALSLNKAKARISHSIFRDNEGDDGLNMKSSSTLVEYCLFENNVADALDADGVATPEIAFSQFINNGNDGIDLGEGTLAYAHDNVVSGSDDKGISTGELAKPVLENNLVVNNGVGIGIKDGAEPIIRYNTLYGNDFGIRIFQEDSTLGGGKGTFESGIVWGSLTTDILFEVGETTFAHSCIESLDNGLAEGVAVTGTGLLSAGNGCDDPLFADTTNSDFHLQSAGGRWDASSNDWAADTTTSPCVDSGDPSGDAASEPAPNGSRVNMGAYANTEEASKSL